MSKVQSQKTRDPTWNIRLEALDLCHQTLDIGLWTLDLQLMPANFDDLVALMSRLRSAEGCPWDREQTYETLAPMLLEEAYEAFEAVEEAREGKPLELRDELGDLLFQIVFYAQVAGERGEFTIADVTEA